MSYNLVTAGVCATDEFGLGGAYIEFECGRLSLTQPKRHRCGGVQVIQRSSELWRQTAYSVDLGGRDSRGYRLREFLVGLIDRGLIYGCFIERHRLRVMTSPWLQDELTDQEVVEEVFRLTIDCLGKLAADDGLRPVRCDTYARMMWSAGKLVPEPVPVAAP